MGRDYELVRRFKIITSNVMILRLISQKNEVVCRDRRNFGAKSKSYDVTMKRASSIDELYRGS